MHKRRKSSLSVQRPAIGLRRGPRAIEEDADCVLFLHHPPGAGNGLEDDQPRTVICNIGKHRHVGTGDVPLSWIPVVTTFGNPLDELPP